MEADSKIQQSRLKEAHPRNCFKSQQKCVDFPAMSNQTVKFQQDDQKDHDKFTKNSKIK